MRIISSDNTSTPLPDHTSDQELSNNFNEFCYTKIEKIKEDFNDNADFRKYVPKLVGDQFSDFRELQEEEVTKMIRQSKTKSCMPLLS